MDQNTSQAGCLMAHSTAIVRFDLLDEPRKYLSSPTATVSVECIRDLYRTSGYTANPKNGNKLGLTGYLEEVANREDLQTYLVRLSHHLV